jgi:ribonucleotide monophosphatase NagD (HAD superfamily)
VRVHVLVCVQAIPGAADVIKHLKAAGVPYKFVTNTTTDKRAGVKSCAGLFSQTA